MEMPNCAECCCHGHQGSPQPGRLRSGFASPESGLCGGTHLAVGTEGGGGAFSILPSGW